jgi:hypothetical protein
VPEIEQAVSFRVRETFRPKANIWSQIPTLNNWGVLGMCYDVAVIKTTHACYPRLNGRLRTVCAENSKID